MAKYLDLSANVALSMREILGKEAEETNDQEVNENDDRENV